jgi:ATP-dependent protease ClpP protease subunit
VQEKVVLDVNNHIVLNTEFDEKMADAFVKKLMTFKERELFVYISSPGGSVFAGKRMIGAMKARSDVRFVCYVDFAASMAFNFFEYCDVRYVTTQGILMAHNAAGGFQGEFPRIQTQYRAISAAVDAMDKNAAQRMGIPLKEFQQRLLSQIWLDSTLALEENAADAINDNISCNKELLDGSRVEKISFMGIPIEITFSNCPLLKEPLKIVVKIPGREDIVLKYQEFLAKENADRRSGIVSTRK